MWTAPNAERWIEGAKNFERNNEFIKFVIARPNNFLDLLQEVAAYAGLILLKTLPCLQLLCCASLTTLSYSFSPSSEISIPYLFVLLFCHLHTHVLNNQQFINKREWPEGIWVGPGVLHPSIFMSKHRKNCECCPVSQLIVR